MQSLINIRKWALFLLIISIAFSYHPVFFQEDNTGMNRLDLLVMGLTVFLFVISFQFKIFAQPQIKTYLFLMLFTMFNFLLLNAFVKPPESNPIRGLSIPLMAILFGYKIFLTHKQENLLLGLFSFLILVIGFIQISTNIGGFVIESMYLVNAKNSLGALLAIVGIVSFYMHIRSENKWNRYVFLLCIFFSFLFLFTIRARSAVVALVIILGFILFKIKYLKRIKRPFTIIVALLFIVLISLVAFINNSVNNSRVFNYVYNSFTLNRENDITAGRIERNVEALELIRKNFWFGNIQEKTNLKRVHNYPLLVLSNYGIVGGWAILILYFYIGIFVVKQMFKLHELKFSNLAYPLLSIQYIISLVEPSFPFGPGTVSFLPFLMFGFALARQKEYPLSLVAK